MPRRNTWSVVERCLSLLIRLTRGPATTDELLEIIQNYMDYGEDIDRNALLNRFEDDRQKLREVFGCVLDYDAAEGTYTLKSMDRPLIDLPVEAIKGLAFLRMTFGDDTTPMAQEVCTLTDSLLMLICDSGREEVERVRGLIEVDLRRRDEDIIAENIWNTVKRACTSNCELEFSYLAPGQSDGIPRTHRVEPMRCFFDPVRSHYYLEAYCVEIRGPKGNFPNDEVRRYRMGRILTVQVLPKRFIPGQRKLKKHELVYELAPEIARGGITKHIEDCEIEKKPDGSAIVRAKSTDLFFDLQTLLHYGANCRVLGGEEALQRMKVIVKKMTQLYSDDLL